MVIVAFLLCAHVSAGSSGAVRQRGTTLDVRLQGTVAQGQGGGPACRGGTGRLGCWGVGSGHVLLLAVGAGYAAGIRAIFCLGPTSAASQHLKSKCLTAFVSQMPSDFGSMVGP